MNDPKCLRFSDLVRRCRKLQSIIGEALDISESIKDVEIPTELNGKQIPKDLLAQCDMGLRVAQMQMLGVLMVLRVHPPNSVVTDTTGKPNAVAATTRKP